MNETTIKRMRELLNMNGDEHIKAVLGKLPTFTEKFKSVDEMENALKEFMRGTNSPKRPNYVKTIKDFYTDREYNKAKLDTEDKLLDKFVDDYIIPYLSTNDLPVLTELGNHIAKLTPIAELNNSDTEIFVQECVFEEKPECIRKDLHWLKDITVSLTAAASLAHRVISTSHTLNDLTHGIRVVEHQVWLILLTRFRAIYGLQDKPVTRGQIVFTINHTMEMLDDLYPEMCQNHRNHILDLDTLFEQTIAVNATRHINEMFEQNLAEDVREEKDKAGVVAALQKLIEVLGNK